jgi:hypothetical protein
MNVQKLNPHFTGEIDSDFHQGKNRFCSRYSRNKIRLGRLVMTILNVFDARCKVLRLFDKDVRKDTSAEEIITKELGEILFKVLSSEN